MTKSLFAARFCTLLPLAEAMDQVIGATAVPTSSRMQPTTVPTACLPRWSWILALLPLGQRPGTLSESNASSTLQNGKQSSLAPHYYCRRQTLVTSSRMSCGMPSRLQVLLATPMVAQVGFLVGVKQNQTWSRSKLLPLKFLPAELESKSKCCSILTGRLGHAEQRNAARRRHH